MNVSNMDNTKGARYFCVRNLVVMNNEICGRDGGGDLDLMGLGMNGGRPTMDVTQEEFAKLAQKQKSEDDQGE
jgi:hypothetical protein